MRFSKIKEYLDVETDNNGINLWFLMLPWDRGTLPPLPYSTCSAGDGQSRRRGTFIIRETDGSIRPAVYRDYYADYRDAFLGSLLPNYQ